MPPQLKYTTVNRKSQNLCQDLCTYLGTQVGTQKNNKTFYNPSGGDGLVCDGSHSSPIPEKFLGTNLEDLCVHTQATKSAISLKRAYLEKQVIPRTLQFIAKYGLLNREKRKFLPLKAITRSNYLPEGRERNLAYFWARFYKLKEAVKDYRERPKFLTLTVAKQETSGSEISKSLNRVMSVLRYQAKNKGQDGKLAYIHTKELQEERYNKHGELVLHVHIPLFGMPYKPKAWWDKLVRNSWGLGSIYKIKTRGMEDMARYVSKYISKSIDTKSNDVPLDVIVLRIFRQRRYGFSREGSFPESATGQEIWELVSKQFAEAFIAHKKKPKLDYLTTTQKLSPFLSLGEHLLSDYSEDDEVTSWLEGYKHGEKEQVDWFGTWSWL